MTAAKPAEQPTSALCRSWPGHPRHLRAVRAVTRAWLAGLGFDADAVDGVVLAVNEAATNAIEHAYPPDADPPGGVTLEFHVAERTACMAVVDHGRWRCPEPDRPLRGRGIPMMNRLVDAVVIHYDATGTRVLLRQPLPPGGSDP